MWSNFRSANRCRSFGGSYSISPRVGDRHLLAEYNREISCSAIQSRDLLFKSKASTDLWSFLSKQNLRNHFRLVLERFRVFCSRVHWPFVTFVFRYHLGRCKPRGCHLSGAIMMPSSKECFPSESLYHRAFGKVWSPLTPRIQPPFHLDLTVMLRVNEYNNPPKKPSDRTFIFAELVHAS